METFSPDVLNKLFLHRLPLELVNLMLYDAIASVLCSTAGVSYINLT